MENFNKKMLGALHERRQGEVESVRKLQESSRRRLSSIIKKKLQTSFIGAIAKVEQYIGSQLWGHGKEEDELTERERRWLEIWNECRTEILDNGNAQIRALESEVQQYTITFVGNKMVFRVGEH